MSTTPCTLLIAHHSPTRSTRALTDAVVTGANDDAIQLLHKALRVRPKDQADFGACLPLLAEPRRRWLADALVQTLGAEHRWVSLLNQ